jgi:hypothetical protein
MEKFGTYLASIKPVISRIKAKAGLKEGSMHKRPSSGTNPVQQTREITIGHPEALAVLSRVND